MPNCGDLDYSTLSREELMKVATDLRAERDKYRDENDMLRRHIHVNMHRFCEDIVPDFTPLGGNRPDCAVASGAAVSLSDVAFKSVTVGIWAENPLPPDVFACAAGILCAPVIIPGNLSLRIDEAERLCERQGPGRTLSVRLQFKSEEEMYQFHETFQDMNSGEEGYETDDDEEEDDYDESWPWGHKKNNYHAVFVKIELPPDVVYLPDSFLSNDKPLLQSIDLRSTRLTALNDYCMSSPHLSQVHLPSTVTSIGEGFLESSRAITSIDLRHLAGLTSLGMCFMKGCSSLTEVHLPPSVTQIDHAFVEDCQGIKYIDLRHLTGLTSLDSHFMAKCNSLTEVRLPPSVTQIDHSFAQGCQDIKSIDLRLTGLTTLGGDFMAKCNSLTEVRLPPFITQIRHNFLKGCPRIVSIDLRHLPGLTSLDESFMVDCHSLMEVRLPDSVTQLPAGFLSGFKLNPTCHWVRREKRNRGELSDTRGSAWREKARKSLITNAVPTGFS